MPGPPNVWGYPACHLVAFLVPLRHQHSGISDCISFHTCALAWPLIVHHGCWLTTAASNLISHPPVFPTALSQSGARGRERFLLSPPSDPCFWYCPRGCIPSVAGRFSLPSRWPLSAGESSDFPCSTLLSTPLRWLLRHSGPCLAGCVNVIYFQRMGCLFVLCTASPPS